MVQYLCNTLCENMTYMAYTTNPHLPKVRMDAVRLVKYRNWSMRKVARHIGVEPSTISRWCKRDKTGGWRYIPTLSSRPYHHPDQLTDEVVFKIIAYREKYRRCAEVIHYMMKKDGIEVSLSSIKRIFKKYGMTRYSKWKKWHTYPPRPMPESPGILTEIDTVHRVVGSLYVYTFVDVCSRYTNAMPVQRISGRESVRFVKNTRSIAPFSIKTLQSDHGSEFGKWFSKQVISLGVAHRHSRVRTPSDNGHLERFNRTLQEECLDRISQNLRSYKKEIPEYLHWYNTGRPHMGIEMKSPMDILREHKCCEAID